MFAGEYSQALNAAGGGRQDQTPPDYPTATPPQSHLQGGLARARAAILKQAEVTTRESVRKNTISGSPTSTTSRGSSRRAGRGSNPFRPTTGSRPPRPAGRSAHLLFSFLAGRRSGRPKPGSRELRGKPHRSRRQDRPQRRQRDEFFPGLQVRPPSQDPGGPASSRSRARTSGTSRRPAHPAENGFIGGRCSIFPFCRPIRRGPSGDEPGGRGRALLDRGESGQSPYPGPVWPGGSVPRARQSGKCRSDTERRGSPHYATGLSPARGLGKSLRAGSNRTRHWRPDGRALAAGEPG